MIVVIVRSGQYVRPRMPATGSERSVAFNTVLAADLPPLYLRSYPSCEAFLAYHLENRP
jgi:hypothetical protein